MISVLVAIMLIIYIIKCVQLDSIPDQQVDHKLNKAFMTELMKIFAIVRKNES